jgi:hypothetical protein
MVTVVRAIDGIVRPDEKAMWPSEYTFSPGSQERTIPAEDHDRVFATVENEDTVLTISSHTGHLGPGPTGRQLRPMVVGFVAKV